jgi:hypothetical protein
MGEQAREQGWARWALFLTLCVVVAAAPMVAHLLLKSLPNAGAWMENRWLNGIYLSWAGLIYFSWAFLPAVDAPWREWLTFLGLELAYPAVCWGLAAEDRVYLLADICSYFSTSLAVTVGVILVWAGVRGLMTDGDMVGILVALVFAFFCILLPGVVGEVAWWRQVELPGGGWLSPALRVGGIGLGMAGVLRNIVGAELF